MTVEGEAVRDDEPQARRDDQAARLDYARRLYQKAKQTTQTYAPTAVAKALDRVESRLVDQMQHFNYESAGAAYTSAKQAYVDPYAPTVVVKALDLAESRIGQVAEASKKAVNASKAAVNAISDQYSSLLTFTQDKIDTLIPEPEEEEEEEEEFKTQNTEAMPLEASVSLRSVSHHVTKRLIKRAQSSLGSLKLVTPERLQAMVHIDLIAYAEQVVDRTKDTAKHMIESTRNNEHVAAAVMKLENSVDSVKAAVANISEPIAANAARLTPYASQLRVRVLVAGRKARDITAHSASYLMTHQIRSIPRDALDTLVHYSFELFGGTPPVEENADFRDLDAKVKRLLDALRDVLVWSDWGAGEEVALEEDEN